MVKISMSVPMGVEYSVKVWKSGAELWNHFWGEFIFCSDGIEKPEGIKDEVKWVGFNSLFSCCGHRPLGGIG